MMINTFSLQSSIHLKKAAFFGLLVGFSSFCNALFGATIVVPPPGANPPFVDVQSYINSANDGDTIQFSAGTYVLQNQNGTGAPPYTTGGTQNGIQVLNKTLNLVGAGQDVTILQAPPAAYPLQATSPLNQYFAYSGIYWWSIVLLDNENPEVAQTVNISDLTVDGSDQQETDTLAGNDGDTFYGSPNRFFAIGYHNTSGTINNVHTTNTKEIVDFDSDAGGGIVNISDTGTVTFNVTNSLIDLYQRIGIECAGGALTATISNNVVNRAFTPPPSATDAATPNGIEFVSSVVGTISNNVVENNLGTQPNAAGPGIIVEGTGANILITENTLNNNDVGIAAISSGNRLSITNNNVNYNVTPAAANQPEGILVQDTNGISVLSNNIIDFSAVPDAVQAIDMILAASSNTANEPFQLSNNQFLGGQTGLQIIGLTTSGPVVTMNGDSFTGTTGDYIYEITAPNDVWPSTSTVFFDGLISGHITHAQCLYILSRMHSYYDDPTLGITYECVMANPPTLTSITPNSGPVAGGNTIAIIGDNFYSSDTQVFFGTTLSPSITVLSDTLILATVPAGTGTTNVTVQTPFGTTAVSGSSQYTYTTCPPNPSTGPLPPASFTGIFRHKKCCRKPNYYLESTWQPSPSANIVAYRVYKNGVLVKRIHAGSPLIFRACLENKCDASGYRVVAVNANNVESESTYITLIGVDHTSSH